MLKWTAVALVVGFIFDLLTGDPPWLYHPVRIMGNSISFLEKRIRNVFSDTEGGERAGGFMIVFFICVGSTLIPAVILFIAYRINLLLYIVLESFMCYQMLAVKSLKLESMKVFEALKRGDLEGARYAVSMIVGRDTDSLDEAGVARAAIETVAENTSDGIIAPIFYMIIGGPILMYLYKGINTMDSMLGYKNERYINFGRYAAKLDDIANYIPARLSGLLMIAGAFFAGFDYKNAKKIFLRDRFNHASPNSAQTESVMAGALNIQLAGNAYYFNKLYVKPTIGDPEREVEMEDIARANRLLYVTSALTVFLFSSIHILIIFFI